MLAHANCPRNHPFPDFRPVCTPLERLKQKHQVPVTKSDGEAKKADLGAYKYLECSALTQDGLKQVFDEAIRCVITTVSTKKKKKKSACVIL